MRILSMLKYILARYILKNVKPETVTTNYQQAVRNLIDSEVLKEEMVFDTYEDIKSLVIACKSQGINTLSTNISQYIEDLGDGYKAAFSKVIFKFLEARKALLTFDYVELIKNDDPDDNTNFYDVCAFFGFIPLTYDTLPAKFLDFLIREKFVGNTVLTDLKEVEVVDQEMQWKNYASPKQQTFIEMFIASMFNQAKQINKEKNNSIKVVKGKTYVNAFGNAFQEVTLTGKNRNENRPSSFSVYVPVCNRGIYSIKDTKFVIKKRAKDLFVPRATLLLRDYLYRVIGSSVAFARYYELNRTNNEMITSLIQEKIFACFYTQEEIRPTTMEKEEAFADVRISSQEEMDDLFNKYDEQNTFTWNFFVPIHTKDGGIDTLTKSEMYVEMLKYYYPEYINSEGSEGKNILTNAKGYEKYKDIPHAFNKKYDPTIVNNKGDFVMAKRVDGMTIAEELNPFCYYDKTGIRTYLGTYTMLHAFELDGVKPSSHMTIVTDGMFAKNVPFYNNWFVYMSHKDVTGSITTDGMVGFDKDVPVYFGVKTTLVGLEKGQSFIMNDRLFFIHNGQNIYLSAINPTNTTGRQNPSWQVEGMYHAQRMLDGKTDLVIRDVTKDPIKRSEMLPMQEIFKESNGKVIPMGKHPVGYNKTYFIKDVYSSNYEEDSDDEEVDEMVFKSVESALGTEYGTRANLLEATDMLEAMFGNEERQAKTNDKVNEIMEDETKFNKYKKNGTIIKKYYRSKLPSIISTVLANYKLDFNEVMVNLMEKDIKGFFRNLPTKMNVEAARQVVLSGKEFRINLSTLSVRNPSVDNANSIFVFATVRLAHPRAKFSYVEVHPLMWALQGGDFDGDLISLQFAAERFKKQIEEKYGLHNHTLKNVFEFKEPGNSGFDTLEDFYLYYATVKKNEAYAKDYLTTLFVDGEYKVNSKEEFVQLSSKGTITTMIGKGLIGVSKSVTMKAMSYVEYFMQENPETFTKANRELLTKYCDRMNVDELVQPTIDIQKWSSDSKKVIDIVLRSFYMNEAVSLIMESNSLVSYQTFAQIREYLVQTGHLRPVFIETENFSYTRYELTDRDDFSLIKNSHVRKLFEACYINYKRFESWETTQEGMVQCFKYDDSSMYVSEESVKELINVLNPDGEVYDWVKESVAAAMEGFEKSKFSV